MVTFEKVKAATLKMRFPSSSFLFGLSSVNAEDRTMGTVAGSWILQRACPRESAESERDCASDRMDRRELIFQED